MSKRFTNTPPRAATFAAALLALALASSAASSSAARAQSGRRGVARTTPSTTADAETASGKNSSGEADAAASSKPAVNFKLVVAGRIDTKNTDRANTIFNKFLQRLGEAASSVDSLGLVKRDEALARAGQDGEAYLVWLQIEEDNVQEGSLVFNSSDLVVKYQIHAPGVKEAKGKGKLYYQAMGGARARQDRFPSGTPIKITPEAAGIEAAEMVLDWFRLVEGPALKVRKN